MRNKFLLPISAILLLALGLHSCSTIEVTKRRHLPGYHLDFSSSKESKTPAREAKHRSHVDVAHAAGDDAQATMATEPAIFPDDLAEATAAPTAGPAATKGGKASKAIAKGVQTLLIDPVTELRREKAASEIRREVFASPQEEKHGWSVVSFISLGFGIVAFIMLISTIATVIGAITSSLFTGLWFIPGILAVIFGIAALITGSIGMKQTKAGGKRGRGFALAGLLTGIISMAIGLILSVVGLLFWVFRNLDD